MNLTEINKLCNMQKKITATQFDKHFEIYYKKCQKRKKKKSAQNFFILKYVIKNLKTSNFYYLKVLAQLNFLWRYEIFKFLILTSKIHVKSETLAVKNVIPTAKKQDVFGYLFLDQS